MIVKFANRPFGVNNGPRRQHAKRSNGANRSIIIIVNNRWSYLGEGAPVSFASDFLGIVSRLMKTKRANAIQIAADFD